MNTRDHLVDHPLNHRIAVLCLVLLRTAATTGRADWTPPESSVTGPSVITVDVFAAPDLNGSYPSAPLVVGPDGAMYGSTASGGTNGGYGTLFRLETNGTFTKLHDFNGTDGANPQAALVAGPDGALYGSTSQGGVSRPYTAGTLFRLQTDGRFAKLHDFNGTDGYNPQAALAVGPDGALYGSTQYGGVFGQGTLFRLETNGQFTKLHDFNGADGAYPFAPLVVGLDGALYGSAQYDRFALYDCNPYGTLFRLQTNGTFTVLHDFNGRDGPDPQAALVAGPDGALYGSTLTGGTGVLGTLFRLETNGTFTTVHNFTGTDGASPQTALVAGPDGALYGSTSGGGVSTNGTLFRLKTNGTFTVLHDFAGSDGASPSAALVVGADGALYGSTPGGGASNNGTLFRLQTDATFTKLHDFNYSSDGARPEATLVVGPDGALYGSTSQGEPIANGTLFRLETNGAFTELYDFHCTDDGAYPFGAFVAGSDGVLYGSTVSGGTGGAGTLFRLETNGTFTKLHDFNYSSDGANPYAALVLGSDGAMYGSTYRGGTNGSYGTLFRLQTEGTFAKLHDFDGTGGARPEAALVVGPDGAMYGSTLQGGTSNNGTLFRLETNGTFTTVHNFTGADGASPHTALVAGPDGALYGSTLQGGTSNNGTLFRLQTDGTFTKLHDFNRYSDGARPIAALVVGTDGAMYGSTQVGGTNGFETLQTAGPFASALSGVPVASGTLFRVETNGTFATLHHFTGSDGALPLAAMVMGPDGAIYGSTYQGGTNGGYGTLFRLETNGTFIKLHDFNGNDGAYLYTAMVAGPDGALYGSTLQGGTSNNGTLFRLETNGTFTKLHDFNGSDGSKPPMALLAGPDGALYGSTVRGGAKAGGILFKLVLNAAPVAKCKNVTVSADADCAASASVDDGSFDPDAGDPITLVQSPPGPYPVGTTEVTLTVTDSHRVTDSCTATVTVVEAAPPVISAVSVNKPVLWPANHQLVDVAVNYVTTDNCDPSPDCTLSVTCNEPANGPGSGNTASDWVIVDAHHVRLRAERAGTGNGRIYALTITCTDPSGNSTTRTVDVTVPKSGSQQGR